MCERSVSDDWYQSALNRHARIKAADGIADFLVSVGQKTTHWHIDLSRSYVSNFQHDCGFDISVAPGQPFGFRAELLDRPRSKDLSVQLLGCLEYIASAIFSMRLAAASLDELTLILETENPAAAASYDATHPIEATA